MATKKSVDVFLDFIVKQVGNYYWFGCIGQKASWSLYNDRKKAYPSAYTANDYAKQIANPKPCFDCAGLVKSLWCYPKYDASVDLGATGIYNKCSKKGKLTNVNQLKNGYLVFKGNDKTKSHVGVYKNGKIYEAKGHAYGVVCSDFKLSDWKYWAEYYLVDYSSITPEPTPEPTPTPEPVGKKYKVSVKTFLAIRKDPDASSNKMGELYNGAEVTVFEESGSWGRISGDLWVSMNYLTLI